jgi:threonine/homoserine/homoserine lactone efflux protein
VIDIAVLATFIPASLVIILSPGADTFLLLRYAIRLGRQAGFQAMFGILLGLSLVSLVLISGVGLLVSRFPLALDVLTFVGIGILLYLALISTRAGLRLHHSSRAATRSENGVVLTETSLRNPLRMSLITNVTNPKVLIFYLAFFPQFLGTSSNAVAQLTMLSVVFLVVTVFWLVPLVFAASAAKAFFQKPLVAMVMEFSVGAVFLALAIVLLFTL